MSNFISKNLGLLPPTQAFGDVRKLIEAVDDENDDQDD